MSSLSHRLLVELTDQIDVPSLRSSVESLLSDVAQAGAVALLPIDSMERVTVPELMPPHEGVARVASEPSVAVLTPVLASDCVTELRTIGRSRLDELGFPARACADSDVTLRGITLHALGQSCGVLLVAMPTSARSAEINQAVRFMTHIAPMLAISLEHARRFTRERVRAARLAAANSLARAVAASRTPTDIYDAMVHGIGVLFGFSRCAVFDAELRALASTGALSNHGATRARSLVSASMHRRCHSRIERHDRTCHAFPLMGGDRTHAVVYVEHHGSVEPEVEHDDVALLCSITEHAAACLVALTAVEATERNYLDTIQALVHALEARDPYTADHSVEVAVWALEVGRRLGMCDADLRDLELGAMLHDIGKMAVPDDILKKPGRLTDDEFEVMKLHTVAGERILKPIGFLRNVAPIVRHEHERWDGRGYPDGIAGDDIPLASRIIFVVDAHHAIISDRPYRTGQTHAFARRIIDENAGTQFDPAVVSVFLDVIDQWHTERGIALEANADGIDIVNGLGNASPAEDAGGSAPRAA